jgi:phosphoglycolate phosphatase-like HAD superfamily hydrolase
MKKVIILFDIDGTIFDAKKFFNDFYEKIAQRFSLNNKDVADLKVLYQNIKEKKGFFDPQTFLIEVSSRYAIKLGALEKLLWIESNFQQYLLIDEKYFKKVQEKAIIGIFSKGEINFQKKKIELLKDFIGPQHMHIFENKIEKISEVLEKYKGYKIFVVDDNEKILQSFKKLDNKIFTILIGSETVTTSNFVDVKIENVNVLINSELAILGLN